MLHGGGIGILSFYLQNIDCEDDKKYFEKLYFEYQSLIYKISYRYLNDVQLSEDNVHDTFLELSKSFDRFKNLPVDKHKRYIATIAERTAMKKYKKETKEKEFSEKSNVIEVDSTDFTNNDHLELKIALEKMPFEYVYPLLLKYAQGLSYKEIAEIFNITEENARQKICRCRKRLKDCLE